MLKLRRGPALGGEWPAKTKYGEQRLISTLTGPWAVAACVADARYGDVWIPSYSRVIVDIGKIAYAPYDDVWIPLYSRIIVDIGKIAYWLSIADIDTMEQQL